MCEVEGAVVGVQVKCCLGSLRKYVYSCFHNDGNDLPFQAGNDGMASH